MTPFTIRRAEACDAETILSFVRGLAMEEKAGHEVEADPGQIVETMFSENSTCHAVICEESGRPIGFAVYFFNYSTWQGKNGLYIEDLYILPEFRNYGAGRKILKYLCNLALTKDCGRVEWSVLNWNTPAIGFYDALGAEPLSEWIRYRLSGKPLSKMGTL
ncbi:MAG: GNAT family N-acetyltransferase [Deltaproteobacteria bacterium RIFOXYC2_FULL_48_10]|nr:MAG: GNAT family N-acetyltransferase [Deltaproteobacteria bacterium RIFOXYC2_FULL_48_10]